MDGFYVPSLEYEAEYYGIKDISEYADYQEHVFPVIAWLKKEDNKKYTILVDRIHPNISEKGFENFLKRKLPSR